MNKQLRAILFAGLGFAAGACDDGPGHECSDVPGASCTWAGIPGEPGTDHHPKHRQESTFSYPIDVTFAPDGRAWIVDWNSHLVRRVEKDDLLVTVMGNANEGDGTCTRATPNSECDNRDFLPFGNPEGAPGPEVSLNHPTDIEFYPNGDALLSAWHNNKVRLWSAETEMMKVISGDDYGYIGDGLPAFQAEYNLPKAIALDPSGVIFVADARNQKIRKIDIDSDRTVTTVLGTGVAGFSGDGGSGMAAQLHLAKNSTLPGGGLTLDADYLYVADTANHRIRRLSRSTGIVDCIAGKGDPTYSGDGGLAVDANLNEPLDLEIGPDGRLWIADSKNFVVRAMDLTTGVIEHVAGTGEPCASGMVCLEAEEGMPASEIRLNKPSGVSFDPDGNLYIADQYNNRIVRVARDW